MFYQDFKFYDNNTSDKLLIVLNSPKNIRTPYLCCKTTTTRRYTDEQGCFPQYSVYVLLANEDFFKCKTWVQLHEFYEMDAQHLLNACHKYGKARIIGKLNDQAANAIVNCAKRSDDMSEYQLSLLK